MRYDWYTKAIDFERLESELNAFSEQGWEIFSVLVAHIEEYRNRYIVIVRKPPA